MVASMFNREFSGTVGLEPTTARLEGECSIQLSYAPLVSCGYYRLNGLTSTPLLLF